MDRGIFATSLRKDCSDTPCLLQFADDMAYDFSSNFDMANGGITTITASAR
jgi:hypothetical protein